ncbi:neurogenic locus notch homolog protein 3-like isoform X1 [Mya arenaria]|uniref:neurogenic locus notch homolog protein 3-like isoform X1 n=1 Tax=Mya arenaria TaxID=6604 RepID=UPI0022E40B99|nr:neurogenic locus notch homolog protein 3-like isoform X1 [Mya arenaria]
MDVKWISSLDFLTVLILIVFVNVAAQTTTLGPDLGPLEPTFVTCAEMNCPPNSKCVEMDLYTYCECAAGKTGVNCTEDDPCLETKENCPAGMTCYGPCNPNVFCEGATGIPHCTTCIAGWIGNSCDKDEDECTLYEDICNKRGKCTNTIGGYKCACEAGYTGNSCELKGGPSSGAIGRSITLLTVWIASVVPFLLLRVRL